MAVTIFFCYTHEDEAFLNKLKAHLRPLQREGLIDGWHDRDISAGTEWEKEISTHLNEAQIILLLVSPDFMDSDYCYGIEMKQAIERHQRGEARVIPIILRPAYWQGILGQLQALPTDAKPVTSLNWHNWDEAFFDVAEGIRKVVLSFPEASLYSDLQQSQDDKVAVAVAQVEQRLVDDPEYNRLKRTGDKNRATHRLREITVEALNVLFGSAPSDFVDYGLSFFSPSKNVSKANAIEFKALEQKDEKKVLKQPSKQQVDSQHIVSSLSTRPLQAFLCHSSGDKPIVRNLYKRLKACNIDPWFDEEDLLPGQNWEQEIRKAVRASDVVIVCLSPGSISKTGFVQQEIKFALDIADEQPEGSIFLIPIKLEDCVTPERLNHLHWVNYNIEDGFYKLIKALQLRCDSFNGKLAPVIMPKEASSTD